MEAGISFSPPPPAPAPTAAAPAAAPKKSFLEGRKFKLEAPSFEFRKNLASGAAAFKLEAPALPEFLKAGGTSSSAGPSPQMLQETLAIYKKNFAAVYETLQQREAELAQLKGGSSRAPGIKDAPAVVLDDEAFDAAASIAPPSESSGGGKENALPSFGDSGKRPLADAGDVEISTTRLAAALRAADIARMAAENAERARSTAQKEAAAAAAEAAEEAAGIVAELMERQELLAELRTECGDEPVVVSDLAPRPDLDSSHTISP